MSTPVITFENADFTKRADIVSLFPIYKQLQLASKKPLPKNINIDGFTMKTPYGDKVLLQSTLLNLEPNRRQCLYGPNSSGKTLLFTNMLSGELRDFPKHLHVHHCKELENHELGDTVIDTVVNSHPYRNILSKCEKKLKDLIAAAPEDKAVLAALKDNLEYIQNQMNSIRGYDAVDRAGKMLRVLGFDEIGQKKLVSALSGGLRMRVALCMAFFIEAEFLLLDEPTNHLDFPSVLWLENRLRGYKGSFLLVSHDRELLNNVCTSVIMIEDQQLKYYACGFSEFEKKKAIEDKKKCEEVEKFLKKNENAAPTTLQGKLKLEKKKWQEGYLAKQVAMQGKFTFPAPVALKTSETKVNAEGKEVAIDQADISLINLQNVRFSYDVKTGHFIFNDPISFNVTAATRVGVMGPNGAGKSTFLKLLTYKLKPVDGTVTQHPDFTLAYFGQHSTAELDLELTPIEFMMQQFPNETKAGALRGHLAKTGITGQTADTRMKGLSFSQRSCIIFAKLTYVCPHLLIMDEPTNFLDLESVDSLIQACNKYKGALLLVSHNRDFLKKCAKQYLSIVPGHFNLYDTLKVAEKATYTFIDEMESGNTSGLGKDALANNPGGGTVHSTQKVAPAGTEGASTTGTASTTAAATPAKAAAAPAPTADSKTAEDKSAADFVVGEKIKALWSDGKFYNATIKKVEKDKFIVHYTEYGNTTALPLSSLQKLTQTAPKGNNNQQQNRGPAPNKNKNTR